MRALRPGKSALRPGRVDPAGDIDLVLSSMVNAAVLLTGATSAERELCARLIHARGRRARGPFVTFSAHDHLNRSFVAARDGTLFLADLDGLAPAAQEALEHALDQVAAMPLESERPRLISGGAAVWRLCQSCRFSNSLFYRLNTIHIDLDRTRIG